MNKSKYNQESLVEAIKGIEDQEHRTFLNNYIIHLFKRYAKRHDIPNRHRNEILDSVLKDSIRLFPRLLETPKFPNVPAYAYTATIVKSAMAKYLHPYYKNSPGTP